MVRSLGTEWRALVTLTWAVWARTHEQKWFSSFQKLIKAPNGYPFLIRNRIDLRLLMECTVSKVSNCHLEDINVSQKIKNLKESITSVLMMVLWWIGRVSMYLREGSPLSEVDYIQHQTKYRHSAVYDTRSERGARSTDIYGERESHSHGGR